MAGTKTEIDINVDSTIKGLNDIEKGASTIDEQTKEKEEFDYAKNVLSL